MIWILSTSILIIYITHLFNYLSFYIFYSRVRIIYSTLISNLIHNNLIKSLMNIMTLYFVIHQLSVYGLSTYLQF